MQQNFILINNVGILYPEKGLKNLIKNTNYIQIIYDMINVNIKSHLFSFQVSESSMNFNGVNLIVFVSSLLSLFASPEFVLYSASKVLIDIFSRAVRLEYKSKSMFVQSLLPGYVSTKMIHFIRPFFHSPKPKLYVKQAIKFNKDNDRSSGFLYHKVYFEIFQIMTFISLTINIDFISILSIKFI